MLLPLIVAKLDAELQRLQELRRIVNGISSISPLDDLFMELAQLELAQLKQITPLVMLAPERVSQPQSLGLQPATASKSRSRSKHPESRALTSMIPAAPVMVHAAQVASERQRRVPARTASTGKIKAQAFLTKSRVESTPSVEALRNRWLAEG